MSEAIEARVTLRLPTVMDVEIAPMAIVRWLKANGWRELESKRDGVVMFDKRAGRDGVVFATDPTYADCDRRLADAIQRLAGIERVAPHVMAERIIAADQPSAAADPFATIKARVDMLAYCCPDGEALFRTELFAAYGLTNHPTIELIYEFAHARGQRRGDMGVLESFAKMLPMLGGKMTL